MTTHGAATYTCPYCRMVNNDDGAATCPRCGAPVDIRLRVSNSGWCKQPPIRDMARLQFGASHCQSEGTYVPVADFNLAPAESLGMATIHHTSADETIPELERLLGVPLSDALQA